MNHVAVVLLPRSSHAKGFDAPMEAVDFAIDHALTSPRNTYVSIIGADGETWPEDVLMCTEAVAARSEIPSEVIRKYLNTPKPRAA